MRPRLVIWGASGHARVVADIIRLVDQYEITGFLDDSPERHGAPFCHASILGGRDLLVHMPAAGVTHLLVAIGDCAARLSLAELARAHGLNLATAIHPRATVAADVPVGAGTVVAAGAVIGPGAVLGDNVIVNTCASVDHDCRIEDGVHIGPGAHLAGSVHVGRMTFVGIGAVVRDRVRIGADSVIGAGSVVVADLPGGIVAYGTPARVRGEVARHDPDEEIRENGQRSHAASLNPGERALPVLQT